MLNTLLIGGITALILIGQFRTRPVSPLMYLWVGLLIARGLVPPGPARPTPAGIGALAVALCLSAAFGVLRGRSMPIWRDAAGTVLRRGDRTTFLLWLATVATKLAVGAVAVVIAGEPVNVDALWLGMGVTLCAQQVVMAARAHRLPPATGTPTGMTQPAAVSR